MKVNKTRKNYEYDNNVKEVFKLISYKNSKSLPVGSNSMLFNYSNDYDLFSVVHVHSSFVVLKHEVVSAFKEMITRLKTHKNVYFIKFMAGVDKNNDPVYWEKDDVIKGSVVKDKKMYYLVDILNEKSVIKIDIVAYINGYFIPFSNVYEFKKDNVGINQDKTTIDSVDSLAKDIKKFYDKKNYMKILKRLFIISTVQKNESLFNKLVTIFQSDVGKLYQIKSYVGTISDLLEKYSDPDTVKKVMDELQALKDTASKQTLKQFPESFYMLFNVSSNPKKIIENCNEISDIILSLINDQCKKIMKSQKISIAKYI